jgi:5'-nucleotidase
MSEMKFPVVCANYNCGTTPLASQVKPYTIIEQHCWKIGIIGVCVNPEGLILQSNIEGITYENPIEKANHYASILRNKHNCDYIILLSHLGLHDDTIFNNASDSTLIANTTNIDLLLGGHTHQYNGVFKFSNLNGDTIPAIQEYKAGQKIYAITVK